MTAFLKIKFDDRKDYRKFKRSLQLQNSQIYAVYEKTDVEKLKDQLKKARLVESRNYNEQLLQHQYLLKDEGITRFNKLKLLTFNQEEEEKTLSFAYPFEDSQANILHGKAFYIMLLNPRFKIYLDDQRQLEANNTPRRLVAAANRSKLDETAIFNYDIEGDTCLTFNAIMSREEIEFNINSYFFNCVKNEPEEKELIEEVDPEAGDKFFIKKKRCIIL